MRTPLTLALELVAVVTVVLAVLLAAASLAGFSSTAARTPGSAATTQPEAQPSASPVYVVGTVGQDEATETTETTSPQVAGDDNGDGVIDEAESGWDCSTMGNGPCGPGVDNTHGDETGAVCTSDSDCAAYDAARGIVSDGRP